MAFPGNAHQTGRCRHRPRRCMSKPAAWPCWISLRERVVQWAQSPGWSLTVADRSGGAFGQVPSRRWNLESVVQRSWVSKDAGKRMTLKSTQPPAARPENTTPLGRASTMRSSVIQLPARYCTSDIARLLLIMEWVSEVWIVRSGLLAPRQEHPLGESTALAMARCRIVRRRNGTGRESDAAVTVAIAFRGVIVDDGEPRMEQGSAPGPTARSVYRYSAEQRMHLKLGQRAESRGPS